MYRVALLLTVALCNNSVILTSNICTGGCRSYFHPRPFSGDELQTVAVSDDSMLSVTLPVMSLSTETSYLNHQRNLGSLFNGCHSSYVTNCQDQGSESEDKESLKLQALDSGLVTLATSAVSQSENKETPNGLEMMDVSATDLDHLTTPTIAAPGYRTLGAFVI